MRHDGSASPRQPKTGGVPARASSSGLGVLVLQSVNDDLTYRRIERARRNPSLDKYHVSHAFLVELDEAEQSLDVHEVMFRVEARVLDSDNLFNRLDRQISELRPAILVVHGGFVFCRCPELVLGVLERLKVRHPGLRFGLEARYVPPSIAQATLFECSKEMTRLISQLF
jgi:hypothetical protein